MSFSKDFLWGAASAAYQVEGAYNEDGKGMGIWDALSAGHVKHGDNGNVACDHYHRYKEDVALMKQLGLKAYRFSVSWPRIMPEEGCINEKGLEFYGNLVDELLAAGIMPMWIHEQGGWLCDKVSDYFAEYVKIVVEALSDRISVWMTLNEVSTFLGAGYMDGVHAPFEQCKAGTPEAKERICALTKNILLAHGKAVRVIREQAILPPEIGIAMDGTLYMPWAETEEEIEKARTATFPEGVSCKAVNWWLEPAVKGKLHPEMERIISTEELGQIHQPLDFMGYNCYKANNYDDDFAPNPALYPGIPRTAMDWAITPDALYWAVRFYHERYGLPIMITENGMANVDFVMSDGKIHDQQRIEYLKGYLKGLKRAVDEGYPVIGYLYWSILDNFEWAEGYDKRFGLIYVDYRTQGRTLKDSALWYAGVIQENGEKL